MSRFLNYLGGRCQFVGRCLVLSCALGVGLSSFAGLSHADVGPAPNFTLPALQLPGGKPTQAKLALSAFKGKVTLVDFWASWCGPCRVSFPKYDNLYKELRGQGFEIVGVNLDENIADAKDFLKTAGVSFSLVTDPSGKTAEQFDVMGMPTSYLLDRQGNVIHVHKGFVDGDIEKVKELVLDALAKP